MLLGNVLVLLVLLSCLFVAGEIYYRFIYDTTDSLSYTLTSQAWFRRHFIRNSTGFRDEEPYSLAIEPGKRRISFVGDSFVAGHGVERVEDRFVDRIRQAHPEWEVDLLGDLGFDTGDELRLFKKLASENYQVDQVVLVYNVNDVADIPGVWPEALQRILDRADHRGWLRQHSYLVDTIYHRVQVARTPVLRNYFEYVRGAYSGPLWELQKQRLEAFRDRVRGQGGRLMVVSFPFLHAVGLHYEFQSIHDQMDRFWREEGVPHLDLLSIYRDLPPAKITVNRYDAHPNELAHELAAEKIDAFLKEQIPAGPRRTRSEGGSVRPRRWLQRRSSSSMLLASRSATCARRRPPSRAWFSSSSTPA